MESPESLKERLINTLIHARDQLNNCLRYAQTDHVKTLLQAQIDRYNEAIEAEQNEA